MLSINMLISKKKTQKEMVEAQNKEMAESLKQVFTEFFKECPEVKIIQWTQYTPYFNDGDSCEFGVGYIYFSTKAREEDEDDEDIEESGFCVSKYSKNDPADGISDKTYQNCLKLQEFIEMSEDIMYDLFGDHQEVTVTPEGIDASDYDHD